MSDRGQQALAVALFFLITVLLAVAMRCYVRIMLRTRFGADDALSVAALVRAQF